jgi:hypothetical protein
MPDACNINTIYDMAEDEDGPVVGHLVRKVRLKHLLSDAAIRRVEDGVQRMNIIVETAYFFGKLCYLEELDRQLQQHGGAFSADVAIVMAHHFPLSKDQCTDWLDTVAGDVEGRRGRPCSDEKKARMQALQAQYAAHAEAGRLPAVKTPCTNLSYAKTAEADKMAKCFKTNVHMHYDKYAYRYAVSAFLAIRQAEQADAITAQQKGEATRHAKRAVNHVLRAQDPIVDCPQLYHDWLITHAPVLRPPAPATAVEHWRFYDQKAHHESWMPYMVMLNRRLEGLDAKLYNPFPLRTSFIPGHIQMDTQCLWDLTVNGNDELTAVLDKMQRTSMAPGIPSTSGGCSSAASSSQGPPLYKLPGWTIAANDRKVVIPPKVQKGNAMAALVDIVAPELVERVMADPVHAAAHYRTSLWRCLTKLGSSENVAATCLHRDEQGQQQMMVFNNVIDTDGVSVSIHYVKPELYGQTRFNGGFKVRKTSQKQQKQAAKCAGSSYITALDEEQRLALLGSGRQFAFVDPGKKAIVVARQGRKTVTYTSRQRCAESGQTKHRLELQRRLRTVGEGQHHSYKDIQARIGIIQEDPEHRRSHSSCVTSRFGEYLQTRRAVSDVLRAFYQTSVFRRQRYDAYCGRRSSEDKLIWRLKKAFGEKVVLIYGDWGRNPNLRHQPPSPGIGLRRRLASQFTVLLAHEAYTSSICPACGDRHLTHPRQRMLRSRKTGQMEACDIWHLKKCGNPMCNHPWWNRDILGTLNIERTGMHAMRTGAWHPAFVAAEE